MQSEPDPSHQATSRPICQISFLFAPPYHPPISQLRTSLVAARVAAAHAVLRVRPRSRCMACWFIRCHSPRELSLASSPPPWPMASTQFVAAQHAVFHPPWPPIDHMIVPCPVFLLRRQGLARDERSLIQQLLSVACMSPIAPFLINRCTESASGISGAKAAPSPCRSQDEWTRRFTPSLLTARTLAFRIPRAENAAVSGDGARE